jgi:hypothetical protein
MNSAPMFVPPMLAKLVRTLPEGPEWEYELKLDGYRLEAIKDGDKVRRSCYSSRWSVVFARYRRKSPKLFEFKLLNPFGTAEEVNKLWVSFFMIAASPIPSRDFIEKLY